jgi:hypothetical protein
MLAESVTGWHRLPGVIWSQFTYQGLAKAFVCFPMDHLPFYWRPVCASSPLCKPRQYLSGMPSCRPPRPSGVEIQATVAHKTAASATLIGPPKGQIFEPDRTWHWPIIRGLEKAARLHLTSPPAPAAWRFGCNAPGFLLTGSVPRLTSCHAASAYAENFLYDLAMFVPPLNQTLWMLLVASLIALAGWGSLQLLRTTNPKSVSKRRSKFPSRSRQRSDT